MGGKKENRILVGFAAETENIEAYARGKLAAKNLDMIAANNVLEKGSGFETDTNSVTIYFRDGSEISSGMKSKREVADFILDCLAEKMSKQ
jgi:phosphopantothenoylcysteine decarboxylase/phosphopantothenate--cysteine ligase